MSTPLWLTAWLLAPALGNDEPFRWQRDIAMTASTETTSCAVPFDSHVYSATRDGFPDVRLRRQDGVSISFLIRPAATTAETTVRRTWPARQVGVQLLDTGGMQVLLEVAPDDPLPTGLHVVTPLRDFEVQVRVEESTDGENWLSTGNPAVLFDYSRYIDARQFDLPVHVQHRHLRLTVEDITAEQQSQLLELTRRLRGQSETERTERTALQRRPFRIDRIDMFRDEKVFQAKAARTQVYPPAEFAVLNDAQQHHTVITFSMRREPVTSLRVLTDEANFSRAARVEVAGEDLRGGLDWRAIGAGTLKRFAVGPLSKDERTLTVIESRGQRYRLVIENRDSPPLKIDGVEPSGPVYEAVFLAKPGDALRLEYGSPNARAAQYDVAAVEAALSSTGSPQPVLLTPPRENTAAPTLPRWVPWNDPAVLLGGIVALTVLLGIGLFTASRRVESAREPPPHEPTA